MISDIYKEVISSKLASFADDTSLHISYPLSTGARWAVKNNTMFNIIKYHCIYLATHRVIVPTFILLGSTATPYKNSKLITVIKASNISK